MDEFDYLNGSLDEWLEAREYRDEMSSDAIEWADTIAREYLPEFEAAIWKRSATLAQLGSDMGVDSIEEFVDTAKQFTV